ncbi:MAG: hypothetical protein HY683_00115 [Chloroflexi bacterium]|nr:hypothetical protein [Chloroflexota bacterium]
MAVVIPLLTALVAGAFALTVLDQYLERRKPYQFVWVVGLLLYSVASLLHTLWALGVDSPIVFRLWYWTGAMLVAAYLGMGTVYLHAPQQAARVTFVVLLVLTVLSAALAIAIPLQADLASLHGKPLVSEDPTGGVRFYPAYVGALTAFLNAAGALALVGGAVYSAAVFVRRRAASYRVVSNILIAIGALVSSAGGTLERFSLPQPHTLALLIGVVVIYIGFLRSREVFASLRVPFTRRARPA